jgi:hydrogenase maturation factor HypF (carbamoyltransferase family)
MKDRPWQTTGTPRGRCRLQLQTNREVPPNDGGVGLGQATLVLPSTRHD